MKTCSICVHPALDGIILSLKAGRSERDVSAEFKVSRASLQRHRQHAKKLAAKARKDGASVFEMPRDPSATEIATLKETARRILETTENDKIRLDAIQRLQMLHELELRTQQDASAVRSLTSDAVFQDIVGTMLSALAPFPDASKAIDAALEKRVGFPLREALTCSRCGSGLDVELRADHERGPISNVGFDLGVTRGLEG